MSDHVRVRVLDEDSRVVARLEGPAPEVQRSLDARVWREGLDVNGEVFIQIHLGDGDWVTFDSATV